MPSRRATALQIAICSDGKSQADLATIIPATNFDLLFPDTARNFYSFNQTFDDVFQCSGEEIFARLLTGQIGNLTVSFDVTPTLLAPVIAYALGVAATPTGTSPKLHALTELPVGVYQPPFFGLVINFAGQSDARYLRGCVTESFSIKAAARGKITCDWSIRFVSADVLSGYSFPVCAIELPLRFSDAQLSKGATNFSTSGLLRSFDYIFNNALLVDDHAFTGNSATASRLERADRRVRTLNYQILGDNEDALYSAALAGDTDVYALLLGTGTLGAQINIPSAFTVLNGTGIVKNGTVAETNISVTATPTARTNVQIRNQQATAYLLTS